MGDGIVVPTDKLTSTAEVFQALSTSAGQIAAGVAAANPPEVLWGALGLLMKWKYDEKSAEARDHIATIGTALDSQSKAIRATAQGHKELDQALQQAFQRFQDRLAGDG
ncbi:hypothetical protein [Actinoplanes awajinensis]|uniref:ESX-1 secretion-associated protein n=1 Tax=Actinoplanes awajinensis subsp. mycoplanecinus TaxID=135947 RepID=A0A0X3V6X8_9ACTN|nr:hypothetical protein [Actinoplanes awajinensis]KUL40561.1 hypothetical protein ADL15_06100 [Actinoplanes awajinensis subsp. mycoplanecinus]